jgi:hypothetical protein
MRREEIIQRLANAEEPSIRWKTRVGVLDEDPTSRGIKRLQLGFQQEDDERVDHGRCADGSACGRPALVATRG